MVSTRKLWQTDKAMLDESKRARESVSRPSLPQMQE